MPEGSKPHPKGRWNDGYRTIALFPLWPDQRYEQNLAERLVQAQKAPTMMRMAPVKKLAAATDRPLTWLYFLSEKAPPSTESAKELRPIDRRPS